MIAVVEIEGVGMGKCGCVDAWFLGCRVGWGFCLDTLDIKRVGELRIFVFFFLLMIIEKWMFIHVEDVLEKRERSPGCLIFFCKCRSKYVVSFCINLGGEGNGEVVSMALVRDLRGNGANEGWLLEVGYGNGDRSVPCFLALSRKRHSAVSLEDWDIAAAAHVDVGFGFATDIVINHTLWYRFGLTDWMMSITLGRLLLGLLGLARLRCRFHCHAIFYHSVCCESKTPKSWTNSPMIMITVGAVGGHGTINERVLNVGILSLVA